MEACQAVRRVREGKFTEAEREARQWRWELQNCGGPGGGSEDVESGRRRFSSRRPAPKTGSGRSGARTEAWPARRWPRALLSADLAEAPSHPARSKHQATKSPGACVVRGLCMYDTGPWPGRPGWNPLPSPTQSQTLSGHLYLPPPSHTLWAAVQLWVSKRVQGPGFSGTQ